MTALLFVVLVGAWLIDAFSRLRGRQSNAVPVVAAVYRWLLLALGGVLLVGAIVRRDVRDALLGGVLIVLASLHLAIRPLSSRLDEQAREYKARSGLPDP